MILDAIYAICIDFLLSGWINVPKKYSKSSEAVNFKGLDQQQLDEWITGLDDVFVAFCFKISELRSLEHGFVSILCGFFEWLKNFMYPINILKVMK